MNNSSVLYRVADILEKAAEYIDELESEKVAKQREIATKIANTLASRVSETIGEPIDDDLIEKLSGTDSEIRNIINKLAGGEDVESMGGPTEVKTASVSSRMGSAEQGLVNWLLT